MKNIRLILFAAIVISMIHGVAFGLERPRWEPRLFVTATGAVWSPGGIDKDRFTASLGGSASVFYWINWNTQLMVSGSYVGLKTQRFYWMPEALGDTLPDVWDVNGSLWVASLEARRMFPTDNKNYLYLALGGDYYHFGDVKGQYQIYTTGAVITGEVREKRDPSDALGFHIAPGLFFLLYPRLSIDVAVRIHMLFDGQETVYWLQPGFSVGLRIF